MLKEINKLMCLTLAILIVLSTNVIAHGGNITGWKNKNSSEITKYNGMYYGYHNEKGEKHYHQVQWDEENLKWKIINPAVYYDKDFNMINVFDENLIHKKQVTYFANVDGDTAKFKLNEEIITVRFLGINTPETVSPTKEEEPYGKEASNFTKEKLENANKIEIEYDSNALEKDKYNRHLAWIWIDDTLLQEELVINGLAETYMLQNNYKYAGKLQLAEAKAKENGIGIWSKNVTESSNNEGTSNENYNTIYYIIIMIIIIITAMIGYKRINLQ